MSGGSHTAAQIYPKGLPPMNLRQLADEFGIPVSVVKLLMPDLFPEHTSGSTYIHPNEVHLARNAWHGRLSRYDFIVVLDAVSKYPPAEAPTIAATPRETIQVWRELRQQLSRQPLSQDGNAWAMSIDPFDITGNVYVVITQWDELKWSDRGPELYDRLVGALAFLKENM